MLPDPLFQIKKEKETADHGTFIIEPLRQGYGYTLGNSLRRVLLSSLPGAAITQVKIAGVKHKFSTLKGMKEDVIELILNLKQLRIKYQGEKPVKISLDKSGPGAVTGKDIRASGTVEVINKDHILANLADRKTRLKAEMLVGCGYGYLPAEEREKNAVGTIFLDALFTPVRKVNYRVEAARLGRRVDLDRLVLEINTDGTLKPSEALRQSAEILVGYFGQVVKPKKGAVEEKPVEATQLNENLRLTIEEIGLPTRIVNALRQSGYGSAGDVAAAGPAQIAKVKNVGEKSIKIIQAALKKKGIDF
jgi:DNA-directed RNA polymerase subunit alpha